MKRIVPALLLIVLVAACQPSEPQGELPTLAVLPSESPTEAPTATETQTPSPSPTETTAGTDTPTPTNTPTETLIPSETPRPTTTPIPTTEPTTAAIATGTAAVLEAPRFSTLTPPPAGSGVQPPSTPLVAADVIITEPQFQEEVNTRLPNIPAIESARINFVPDGISVDLTALGGEAFITGKVLVSVQLTGDFATITIGDIQVNAPEPPQAYLDLVTGDFFLMMLNSLDSILKQRLGPDQNLKSIVVTDTTIEVILIVPEP
jgi:hypothetical protein